MSERAGTPLSPGAEQELMRRLGSGDEEAVRTIYQRFARPVYAVGLRLLGSAESAEELTQDVFLAAWRKAGRFDPGRGRLSTWLMAIAHNLAVDRIRREAARGLRFAVPLNDIVEEGLSAEEGVLDRESARRALAGLSASERKLLRLAYFQGWTSREIAETEGIPLGTVKTRIRATLIKLRRAHKAEEE